MLTNPEDKSSLSLETRVTVLETMFGIMHSDFKELRTTITTTAMSVVGCILLLMLGSIVYFVQQKDAAVDEIVRKVQLERTKDGQ